MTVLGSLGDGEVAMLADPEAADEAIAEIVGRAEAAFAAADAEGEAAAEEAVAEEEGSEEESSEEDGAGDAARVRGDGGRR